MGFGELSSYLRSTCGPDGRPVVGVERSEADVTSVRAAIERILAETSAERLVRGWRGQRVVLKPNFCREGRRGETTSVTSIEAVLGILKDSGCDIVLGDGMTQAYLPPRNPGGFECVAARLAQVARKYDVPFTHFDEPAERRIAIEADGVVFRLPSCLAASAGLVDLAALKVHPQMVGAFAVKNHMGLLSGPDRLALHRTGIAEGIWRLQACVAKAVPQQIHLVDGLLSFQGYDAPVGCLEPGLLIGGLNPCAVDFACAQVMGIDPESQFPQYEVAVRRGFAYGRDLPLDWRGPSRDEIGFQCHIPDPVLAPPSLLPSVRIIWGSFSYPMNRAVHDLLRHMDRDLPLDVYVGGAAPARTHAGRWPVCLGNASIAAYQGGCERVIAVPGDPPAGVEFSDLAREIDAHTAGA